MKKLNEEQIKMLETIKVVQVFSNFEEIVNSGVSSAIEKPFYLNLTNPKYWIKNDKHAIYSLGQGYILLSNTHSGKQTTTIYKVVENVEKF